ncbi:GNAT family N-acetyltransferase [Thermostichus vulcanus]|uniref:GNAT family N-acetyltransferase n=1 Tax=Thermostichus vulcanus str. 'Rupite' TaxID=2813851 RepID=A0ABT0CB85_THEVL|nr:GNAT family N-acetyltransferase [Thermostichus vulcanus]MCJ2542984.1 GNAT family N-acetyltransferase [Thermostichus vulcanus str. 'Rupite']
MQIRPATPLDVPAIFELIQALAEYEQLSHLVTGSVAELQQYLFGPEAVATVLLAEVEECPGSPVGFALYFRNFSTFLTRPGIYLEDLFVLPEFRGRGIGKALLVRLAQEAVAKGYGRLEWMVLDWNEPAIGFYKRLGAKQHPEWILNRVTGADLLALAQSLDPEINPN